MGLDMYLNLKRFIWYNEDKISKKILSSFPELGKIKKLSVKPKNISFELIYWRKANAIHNWFVSNVQKGNDDCGDYYVSPDQIIKLLETIRAVLADRSLAKVELPTTSGFFFGSTEYDDYYWEDLERTEKIISDYLDAVKRDPASGKYDLEYTSSW
jgi:hypothetical protein